MSDLFLKILFDYLYNGYYYFNFERFYNLNFILERYIHII